MSTPDTLQLPAGVPEVRLNVCQSAELIAYRMIQPAMLLLANRVLAAQGDRAEPELIKLQHTLVLLGQPMFAAKHPEAP